MLGAAAVSYTHLDVYKRQPESTLEEIGLDSLGTVEILVAVEDEFGIQLDTEENPKTCLLYTSSPKPRPSRTRGPWL